MSEFYTKLIQKKKTATDICQITFTEASYNGIIGETVHIEWEQEFFVDVGLGTIDEVYVAFFSGWSPAQYYMASFLTGTSIDLELPRDLDLSLEYTFYVETALDETRLNMCWRYARGVVLLECPSVIPSLVCEDGQESYIPENQCFHVCPAPLGTNSFKD